MSHPGCFVSGLYLEGADWDIERGCLVKSKPKVLVVDLPILKIIPIEGHRLKLQVSFFPGPMVPSLLSKLGKSWRLSSGPVQGKTLICIWVPNIRKGPSSEPVVETQGN